jgi:hypothetical protein
MQPGFIVTKQSDSGIAMMTKPTAKYTSDVIVVEMQSGPFAAALAKPIFWRRRKFETRNDATTFFKMSLIRSPPNDLRLRSRECCGYPIRMTLPVSGLACCGFATTFFSMSVSRANDWITCTASRTADVALCNVSVHARLSREVPLRSLRSGIFTGNNTWLHIWSLQPSRE